MKRVGKAPAAAAVLLYTSRECVGGELCIVPSSSVAIDRGSVGNLAKLGIGL